MDLGETYSGAGGAELADGEAGRSHPPQKNLVPLLELWGKKALELNLAGLDLACPLIHPMPGSGSSHGLPLRVPMCKTGLAAASFS